MSAHFGEEIASGFKKVASVWAVDAVYKDVSGTATFTAKETAELTAILSRAGKLLSGLQRGTLEKVAHTPAILNNIKIYFNAKVKAGQEVSLSDMIAWFDAHWKADAEAKKSAKGKADAEARGEEIKAFLHSTQGRDFIDYYNEIVRAKIMVIKKMDKAGSLSTFLKTADGMQVTGHEGFVAIDHTGSNAVKLVDRLQFSNANFNPAIIKGWVR